MAIATPIPTPVPRSTQTPPPITVVDPTQGSLPPVNLDFQGYTRDDNREKKLALEDGDDGGSKTKGLYERTVEAVLAWEKGGTRGGAEAALAATARLIAGDPLNVDALSFRGIALHLLDRYYLLYVAWIYPYAVWILATVEFWCGV